MLKRQLTDKEKEELIKEYMRDGSLRCFVDNHPIEDISQVDFHHISPRCERGPTTIDNMAPVCKDHHKLIRTLSLQEFRDKLMLEEFFTEFKKADGIRLDEVLYFKLDGLNYGNPLNFEKTDKSIKIYWNTGPELHSLYTCSSGFQYFYALIPIEYIKNDFELQPRPLESKRMWELYRHFLRYTQLAPAICRLVDRQVLLFDGQHKTAAQIWAGRKYVDCKIYIDPDIQSIKETVLAAHDKLRQMPFYTSKLISIYSDLFKDDWEDYLELAGQKSEAGFVEYLIKVKGKTKTEGLKMLRSAIQDDILDDPENLLKDYISEKNKTRKNPLTMHAVQRTFIAEFIAQQPMSAEFESQQDFRKDEKKNMIKLMNSIVNLSLLGRWNPEAKNSNHLTAERIYASGSLRAWVPILRSVIAAKLGLIEDEDRHMVFYREIDDKTFKNIVEPTVKRLFSHKLWIDPDPEIDTNLRVNNTEHVKQFLNSKGFSSSWLMGIES